MSLLTGTVKFFADNKGYGFIIPDVKGPDLFFHKKNCTVKDDPPQKGDKVQYVVLDGRKGPEGGNVTAVVK